MKQILPFLFLLFAGLINAEETADLGSNLAYLRVHSLADAGPALRSALAVKHACVLDLRYATTSNESASALKNALSDRPADAPLFILVSPATPAGVFDTVDSTGAHPFITLGIAGSRPAPQITIKTEEQTDRRAYEAFDTGTSLTDLVSGKIEKDRFDEATLVEEFKNGNADPETPLAFDPTKAKTGAVTDKSADSAHAKGPAPLKDRVLQRALNLHQALLALRPSA
jgi:hypothetical protein